MSEDAAGFDKEAEKEKLRAQLEREEENRRSTQHMSELLLKGATMTNKHCDICGDPLFRYEGQEFCPSCTQEGTAEGTNEQPAGSGDAATTQPRNEPESGVDRVATAADDEPRATDTTDRPPVDTGGQQPTSRPGGEVPEDVAGARDALARKLAALAARAEATDDISQSRELLAAAREAAEALAAIDRVRQ